MQHQGVRQRRGTPQHPSTIRPGTVPGRPSARSGRGPKDHPLGIVRGSGAQRVTSRRSRNRRCSTRVYGSVGGRRSTRFHPAGSEAGTIGGPLGEGAADASAARPATRPGMPVAPRSTVPAVQRSTMPAACRSTLSRATSLGTTKSHVAELGARGARRAEREDLTVAPASSARWITDAPGRLSGSAVTDRRAWHSCQRAARHLGGGAGPFRRRTGRPKRPVSTCRSQPAGLSVPVSTCRSQRAGLSSPGSAGR